MKSYIIELNLHPSVVTGYGNGYVLLPITHLFYGVHYDEIPVSVHGGLTYSKKVDSEMIERVEQLDESDLGYWCIGFDTAHYQDSLENWPKEAVQAELDRLVQQLEVFNNDDIYAVPNDNT